MGYYASNTAHILTGERFPNRNTCTVDLKLVPRIINQNHVGTGKNNFIKARTSGTVLDSQTDNKSLDFSSSAHNGD